MTDETRDALLMSQSVLLNFICSYLSGQIGDGAVWDLFTSMYDDHRRLYKRARHEIERPEDRG